MNWSTPGFPVLHYLLELAKSLSITMGRKACPGSGPGAQLLLTSAGRRPGMDGRLGSSDRNTSKGMRTATKTRDREMA